MGFMSTIPIAIIRLPHAGDLPLPAYATVGSAGMDLLAAIPETITLAAGAFVKIPVGVAIALPDGYEAQVRPRSGLAVKFGVTVLNAPGTIDSDYRGEIMVPLINHGASPFIIERGMRIAQLIIAPYTRVVWALSSSLDPTDRGTGGFGSTGVGKA